jgi:DNA-directed RNA polymerase specialized sigma24 family protein
MTKWGNLWLNEIAKNHTEWIRTVKGIGGDMYAEDIVQEMYIKLHKLVQKRGNHFFLFDNGKVQSGYIFFTLRSILYSYLVQKNKHRKSPIEWLIKNLEKDKQVNPVTFGTLTEECYIYDEQGSEKKQAEQKFLDKIDLEALSWEEYDRDLFKIYKDTGMSFRTMSKYTEISHTNLYNTVKRCKEKLKDTLQEDWEDLNNEDYELL